MKVNKNKMGIQDECLMVLITLLKSDVKLTKKSTLKILKTK